MASQVVGKGEIMTTGRPKFWVSLRGPRPLLEGVLRRLQETGKSFGIQGWSWAERADGYWSLDSTELLLPKGSDMERHQDLIAEKFTAILNKYNVVVFISNDTDSSLITRFPMPGSDPALELP